MTEIILINPYYSERKEVAFFYKPTLPLGLLYLAAYLRKFGLNPKIKEFGIFDPQKAILKGNKIRFGISDNKIIKIIKKENPKIVGITAMYSIHYGDVIEIARIIKNVNRRIKIVIGGNHASSYWNFILKDKNIDFVVIGEGEVTFLELCKGILKNKNKKKFLKIKGIAFRYKRKIIRTPPRELISNLDEIPFPARDLINFKRYLVTKEDQPYLMRYPATGIITSRGCPGKCVYCTVRAVWGRTWRGRSSKNVVDEIEELIKKYGVREFSFLDDSASLNKIRWKRICEEIIKRKIDIKWTTPNGIAHWTLDKPTLKKMYKAGCYRVTFGIESGNPATRRFLGKPYSLSQAKKIIQYANRIGMWTISTNIIGFPYEKLNSILDTIEFAKKSGVDFATFYLLIPQPTSDVYQYFRKENLLNLDKFFEKGEINENLFEKISYILNETGCDTKYFKKEELRILQKKAYRDFILYRLFSYFIHPQRIIWKIKTLEDLFYVLKLISQGLKIFLKTFNPSNLKTIDLLYSKTDLN